MILRCFRQSNTILVSNRLSPFAAVLYRNSSSDVSVKNPTTDDSELGFGWSKEPVDPTPFQKLDTTFQDHEEAFKSKTDAELIRALFVYKLCGNSMLVRYQKPLFDIGRKILGDKLMETIVRKTFYGHFVAGEDIKAITPRIDHFYNYGVKSILDYSVEKDLSESEAESKEVDSCKTKEQTVGDELKTKQQAQSSGTNGDSVVVDPEIKRFRVHRAFGDRRKGVVAARTYFYKDEAACDENMKHFEECIQAVATATRGRGFAAIKITALGRPQFLMNVSELLVRMETLYMNMMSDGEGNALKRLSERQFRKSLQKSGLPISRDASKDWFTWIDKDANGTVDLFEWQNLIARDPSRLFALPSMKTFVDSLGNTTRGVEDMLPTMSDEDKQQLTNMLHRINRLAEIASDKGVRLMIDAEQSYFQPAINRIVIELQRQFNKDGPTIFNTYQCYLKDTHRRVQLDLELSRKERFYFGCKLVRGAYMEQERERAQAIGYPDPICDNIDETAANYERVFKTVLHEAKRRPLGEVSVAVTSHNLDSIRMAIQTMRDYNIGPEDKVVCFGQLMGMCDHVSFPLGQAGFSVYKYVPYGPVFDVMPYLMRRAQENSGIIAKLENEKDLIRKEIARRRAAKKS